MKKLIATTICTICMCLPTKAVFLTGPVASGLGVANIFVDQTEWENAVIAAGLQVVTEDFSSIAAGATSVSVGGADFDFFGGQA